MTTITTETEDRETKYVVSGLRLKVGLNPETDLPVYREHGEEIPEAQNWGAFVLMRYLANNRIEAVHTKTLKIVEAPRGVGRPRKE